MQQILDALGTFFTSVAAFLPLLLGAIIVFVIGWILAAILGRLTRAALERVGFNRLIYRGKAGEAAEKAGAKKYEPASIAGSVVFWIVLIGAILIAADILGIVGVAALLTGLVAFLPNILVAVVALVLAIAAGEIVAETISASIGDRVSGSETIATVAKWGIIIFGVFIALTQLNISPVIINGLFLALVGTIAVVLSIAFGVGNIELARQITRRWYEHGLGKMQEARGSKQEAA